MKPRRRASARESALAVVARRMVSEAELKTGLTRRGYSADEVADAAQLVRSYKYVDDENFAAAAVREAGRTGRGPFWVRQTLLKRGIPENLARSAATAAEKTARDDARNAVARRFGAAQALAPADHRRARRFLLTRGFSAELAAELFGEED
jgi:regulatory protein